MLLMPICGNNLDLMQVLGDLNSFLSIQLNEYKSAVLQQTDFGNMSPDIQKQFVKLILNEDIGLIGIRSLTFVKLDELTIENLALLLEHSPSCQNLRLIDMNILKANSLILNLQNIRFLQIQQCSATKITIQAPNLKTLIISYFPNCEEISLLDTKTLQHLTLKDCPKLKNEIFKTYLIKILEFYTQI
eukprot:TRINITY_DN10965_c0_g1_i8.p1 TRINITY_DN10965_c0_g1~~TRINITY_DN10965_c0_g1_i8.p1  ORF type:complete len:188 (-),score=39.53 TRINITY_DN10965_c0_g1_i8:1714-2277(-)